MAFKYLGQDLEVNLKFISATEIRKLNCIYRHKDEVTDVLSFELDDEVPGGDIVICLSEAKKNAKCSRFNLEQTVALLLVHGILHLADFDHKKKADRAKMEKAEEEILARAGIELER